jgi:hypothetical protein
VTNISLIVRPFQAVNVAPAPNAPGGPAVASSSVTITAGRVGEGKTFTGSFSASESFYMDAAIKETARKTSMKRVENPDDPEQYVNVEQVDDLTTKQGAGKDYRKSTYHFNNKKIP